MPASGKHYLFDAPRECKDCRRPLPKDYTGDICPRCKERDLFSRVKEYIRANDVTEYMVAEEFKIPLSKVKHWIREGRIEYKELASKPKIEAMHCVKCGTPIQFGSICSQCHRKSKMSGATTYALKDKDERFHTLSDKDQK